MNFGMIDVLVGSHARDIGRQVASRRTATRCRKSWPSGAAGRPGLRSRIGFALVEMGLRLQLTASPMRSNSRITAE
jgi:hypothetical protein